MVHVEPGFLADLRDPTVLAPLARPPGAALGVATRRGCARCSSRRWVAFRRTQAQQRQQIGQIDQPFRLCLLIRAECRPTVLLVEKRLQSPIESFGQVQPRQVPRYFDLEVDLRVRAHQVKIPQRPDRGLPMPPGLRRAYSMRLRRHARHEQELRHQVGGEGRRGRARRSGFVPKLTFGAGALALLAYSGRFLTYSCQNSRITYSYHEALLPSNVWKLPPRAARRNPPRDSPRARGG